MAVKQSSVGADIAHDSAALHVSGSAAYVDDVPTATGTLHAAVGLSPIAHGTVRSLDLDAVRASQGVIAAIAADSIPGTNDIGPVLPGDPVFAQSKVQYAGQAMFAVAALHEMQARRAARRARMDIKALPAVLTIEQALEQNSYIIAKKDMPRMQRNWSASKLSSSEHRIRGSVTSGAQEHFYLEGQAAYAEPDEDGGCKVLSSTQHPSEVQHAIAKMLGLPMRKIQVAVRRMGGGFGGKETQGAQVACIAALLALHTGRPVKLRLPRAEDFRLTGKRHPFLSRFDVGFDSKGRITAADILLAADCGCSADLSLAILDRALFHADNAYHLPCVRLRGLACRTNKASNTAFRGFGGPQGMLVIERIIEDIARFLNLDPLDVRTANFYTDGQSTPYHQKISDCIIRPLVAKLAATSSYRKRRKQVARFNADSSMIKRGLALTPVKFGISFTTTHLNQAGALIHIYRDGSIHLNHGGTEMGQGLMIKVAQVVADELGQPISAVHPTTTVTDKVPNTSATAASAGSDLNGKAAQAAACILRERLAAFAAKHFGVSTRSLRFADGQVIISRSKTMSFADLVDLAYMNRISLSATGFYRTPKIHYDRKSGRGHPFFYFAYGAAVSEMEIDVLTGEYRLVRTDILHDVGASINPAIDLGQIEGGYIQGLGWLGCEQVCWSSDGRLTTFGPATYKIPAASDLPADFRVAIWPGRNNEDTVCSSKAVGEPPLMLAISAWAALADAIASASDNSSKPVDLPAPATPESVLNTIVARSAQSKKSA